jgi:streptogramin lyase
MRSLLRHFRQLHVHSHIVLLAALMSAATACYGEPTAANAAVVSRHSQINVHRFRLPGGVYGGPALEGNTVAMGPGGNVWFTYGQGYGLKRSSGVARMTPTGRVTLFPAKLGANEQAGTFSVIEGPDGALWFTLERSVPAPVGWEGEMLGGAVGRITPTGVMTIFPLPTTLAPSARIPCKGTFSFCYAGEATSPRGLAVGPEGDVWAAGGLDSIWRITPSGEITTFHTPTPSSWPDGIAFGPNGWLWFTETTMNQFLRPPGAVGHITPSGTIGELRGIHAKAAGHRVTAGLVFGPGGALWVGGQGFIDKVSSDGRIATYPVAGDLFDGTRDAQGNAWFGASGYGYADRLVEVARGNAQPSLIGPLLPELHSAAGIAAASGSKLWLLGDGGHSMTRVSIR